MKKTLFTATLLAASLMAASTVQAAPQEVTMWHYFDQKPEQEMLADMVEEYNSLQDDIHINATFVSRTELMNQYTVGALSGELPDIGQVDSPDMESYISLGVFEDITDELESWGELDQFYDGPLSSCKDPDGKVYGLPQNSNCLALACNMDLLKAAGYDHMPQSLDEFKEMVAATTDASNDVYGFAMCAVSTEEGTFQILPWLRSVQNGTGVNVDNITADSAVNGLQTLGDFVANGYMSKECVNWTQADAWNQFCAGKAAFAECGTWHLAQTDAINGAFEYDFTLLPTVQAAPQEVTMWHYFDQKPEQEMLADMVEEYNSLQDDIHINATFVSRTELMNQYTVGALSGELPDIGQVDSPDMESYISLGVFEDITDELESWGELDQFYDGPLSSCKDPDGKVYGLPQNSNCLALACNMDLLKAAGYDHMPQSLDEFKEMVAATTDASNDVYGFAMCAVSTEEGTFQILPWLRSVQNGTGVNVDNITADSAVNGLQTLGDFVANGYMSKECVNWTQADAWNQFCAGKAAFAECGTWHLAQTDAINGAFEYDFTLLPTGDEGTSTSTIGGENFGVCKGSENKEACAKFLEWLCSQENEAKWAAVGGKIPTRQDATAEYTFEQDGFKVFTDEMNYAQARGPHAEWPSISEAVYTATQSVIVDGTSAKDALETAAAKINPIVEETPLPESN